MDRHAFPGFPAFLGRAAEALGFAPALAGGAVPASLAAMANLCAQASTAEPGHVPEILKEAAALRDRLLVAARAAELMLDDVAKARIPGDPSPMPAHRPHEAEGPDRPRPARPPIRSNHHRP